MMTTMRMRRGDIDADLDDSGDVAMARVGDPTTATLMTLMAMAMAVTTTTTLMTMTKMSAAAEKMAMVGDN